MLYALLLLLQTIVGEKLDGRDPGEDELYKYFNMEEFFSYEDNKKHSLSNEIWSLISKDPGLAVIKKEVTSLRELTRNELEQYGSKKINIIKNLLRDIEPQVEAFIEKANDKNFFESLVTEPLKIWTKRAIYQNELDIQNYPSEFYKENYKSNKHTLNLVGNEIDKIAKNYFFSDHFLKDPNPNNKQALEELKTHLMIEIFGESTHKKLEVKLTSQCFAALKFFNDGLVEVQKKMAKFAIEKEKIYKFATDARSMNVTENLMGGIDGLKFWFPLAKYLDSIENHINDTVKNCLRNTVAKLSLIHI